MNQRRPDSTEKRHPIRVVARRTGVTPDLLRAWEKRYGVVSPGRSDGGRRLYSDDDVEYLRLLRRATLAGRRIGQVAQLQREALERLVAEDEEAEAEAREELSRPSASAEKYLQQSMGAVQSLDSRALERTLMRAAVTLGSRVWVEEVVSPLLRRIGDRWSEGALRPAHEHLASAVLEQVLMEVRETADRGAGAPMLVAATLSGERHAFGCLLAAIVAAAQGWRTTYLGPDLPSREIVAAVEATEARAVGLSLVNSGDGQVEGELRALRRELPSHVVIIVGGASAGHFGKTVSEIGAIRVAEIGGLPGVLRQLSPAADSP